MTQHPGPRLPALLGPIALAGLATLPAAPGAMAQGVFGTDVPSSQIGEEKSAIGLRNGSFILAPIPIRNPTIGTGLALGGAYLFTIDKGSDPSGVGIGAFRTDNGSQGYAIGGSANFGAGRWKIQGIVGDADLNYDFYQDGRAFAIEQTGLMGRLGVAYRWSDSWSLGFDLGVIESELGPNPPLIPPELRPDFGITSLTADLTLGYDTRDDTIYPTSGVDSTLRVGWGGAHQGLSADIFGGSDREFTRGLFKYAHYTPVGRDSVLAGLMTACGVDKETPFYLACSLGGSDSFRGFSSTEYIDNALVSLQLAWRGRVGQSRFGYAVFAGAGRVAEDMNHIGDADTHSAAGVGLRYRVSKKFPVDFAVDAAYNDEHSVTTYIYVGQRF